MPNGKPGDHPLTDICNHRMPYFSDEVDDLIRRIVYRGGESRIYDYVLKYDKVFGARPDLNAMEKHFGSHSRGT